MINNECALSLGPVGRICRNLLEITRARIICPAINFTKRHQTALSVTVTVAIEAGILGAYLYSSRKQWMPVLGENLFSTGVTNTSERFLRWAIKLGVDINQLNSVNRFNPKDPNNGKSILHKAAMAGNLALVKTLIKVGAKVDLKDRDGSTALIHAIANEHADIAQELVAAKADVNTKNSAGLMPLHLAACKKHNLELVKVLVAKGAKLNEHDFVQGWAPLHYAVRCCRHKVMEFLCQSGADVNTMAKNDATPLAIATCCGYHRMVQILLASKAYPRAKVKVGATERKKITELAKSWPIYDMLEGAKKRVESKICCKLRNPSI